MRLIKYFVKSCIVTVIDVVIVWILSVLLSADIVIANTIGVVTGFLVDYLLSSRFIFREANSIVGFAVYFGTFLIGLIMADVIIYIGSHQLFMNYEVNVCFLLSKGLSIVIPFFVMYYLRKICYEYMEKQSEMR